MSSIVRAWLLIDKDLEKDVSRPLESSREFVERAFGGEGLRGGRPEISFQRRVQVAVEEELVEVTIKQRSRYSRECFDDFDLTCQLSRR